jgi:hypothetical protein
MVTRSPYDVFTAPKPLNPMPTPTIPVPFDYRIAIELPTGDFIVIDTTDEENIKAERLDSTGEFVAGWQFNH